MRTVLKIGGSVLEPAPSPKLAEAVARAAKAGEELLIVHGGGKALSGLLGRLGIPTEFRRGLRVTDPATLRAAVMAFAGEVNTGLVGALSRAGVAAVGLTGLDGASVTARIEQPELGAVGAVTGADPRLWRALLDAGFTPVVASLAGDGGGGALNVNADQFAAACAAALGADRLLFVTDVPGVLDAAGNPLATVSVRGLAEMTAAGVVHGGMLPKAEACRGALAAGVSTVRIVGAKAALRLEHLLAGSLRSGTQILP